MSRIPPSLARRVDRLARRAHAFHRWSHHPLCDRYRAEVVRLGRRARFCLGCSLTALGAVAGLGAGALLQAAPEAWLVGAGLALLLAVPAAVRPRAPADERSGEGARRAGKVLTRFLPTALAGLAVAQALAAPSPGRLAAAALAALAVGWGVLRYRRRGPDRSACRGCPEGPPGVRCPGFAPMARRERALSRLAGRWIAAALPPPGAPATSPLPPPASRPAPRPSGPPPSRPRPA